MRRRSVLRTLGGGVVPFVGGCVGGDDRGAEETSTPTPTAEAEESPTPTAAEGDRSARERYPDYDWERLADAEPVATDAVILVESTFDPPVAAVGPGAEITFTNDDSVDHTVTIPKLDVDEQVGAGQSTTVTFEETGTYDYVCTLHPPEMLGRMEVTEDLPTGTPTPTPTSESTPTSEPTSTPNSNPTPTDDGSDDSGYYGV